MEGPPPFAVGMCNNLRWPPFFVMLFQGINMNFAYWLKVFCQMSVEQFGFLNVPVPSSCRMQHPSTTSIPEFIICHSVIMQLPD
jgi:hypothetical protein